MSRSSTPPAEAVAREATAAVEPLISVENEEDSNDSMESKDEAMETDENSNGKEVDKGEENAMDTAAEKEDPTIDIKKLKPVIEMPSPRTRPERGEIKKNA